MGPDYTARLRLCTSHEPRQPLPKFFILHLQQQLHKVNRCLAIYSPRATTTNQPTNRAQNEPARPGTK